MKFEMRNIDKVRLDPKNARKHSKNNLKAVKQSLERFGQQKPIVVDKHGVIRAGNCTFQAVKELKLCEKIPIKGKLKND